MQLVKNQRIGPRLGLGITVLIVFLGVVGLTGYTGIRTIGKNLDIIYDIRLPSTDYLIQADRDLQQLLVAERSIIFANAKSDTFNTLLSDYEENLQQSADRFNKYKKLAATAGEKEIIAKYEKARQAWEAVSRKSRQGGSRFSRHPFPGKKRQPSSCSSLPLLKNP